MLCPKCGGKTQVSCTRKVGEDRLRIRRCEVCLHGFKTHMTETILLNAPVRQFRPGHPNKNKGQGKNKRWIQETLFREMS